MKFALGLLLAAAAIAGTFGESTTMIPPPSSPPLFTGLGPQTPAGDNPQIRQGIEQLAGPPAPTPTNNDNFQNVDPRTLVDPKCQNGTVTVPQSGQFSLYEFNKILEEYVEGCNGQTPFCDRMCPDIYQPVCGNDNKIYTSSCNLILAACHDPIRRIRLTDTC